ncbi:MAG: hypothetical protein A2271_00660 [Candidatus Moranbacteria bacterium RIFOXYA12_FULL_35_19]|nr:MAG: hypothetical protein UR78_C0015G0022 [Candidatus Moranbacteria bacterium GW2011_GWF2_35_39]OGI32262.1 MAG: hypothetical protein A2489_02900 [Candidatus Moranbacteria bacterium RIFOXYC12_FULL_36_13]OGI32347.1 MAG: hypothetical protein A2343_04310 [Candidatus Moranbacteria bacterium RIFOXYB12_FULL_35_8]OGI35875.1 MAG: hypothetical protein A2271_00660 [Candidatus Moranbacteria bacterium RIFOXYA12_FULL_35_19]
MADDNRDESIKMLKEIVKAGLRKRHELKDPKRIIMDFSMGSCLSYEEARSMLAESYRNMFNEFLKEIEEIQFIQSE